MDKLWSTVIIDTLALIGVVFFVTLSQASLSGVHTVVSKSDGLEKVKQDTLIDSAATVGITVKGGDVIGAIRFYQGVEGVTVEVSGWGSNRSYGSGAGNLNREWYASDFGGLSSDLDFYSASFKVTRPSANTIMYTQM
jgi:hypothetical protein